MKDSNYYTIYGWMLNQLNLKGTSLLIYAIIYGFSHNGESACSGSLPYLAEMTNCTKQTIINALKSLEKENLIIKEQTRDMTGGLRNHYRINFTILKAKKINSTFEQKENSEKAAKPKNFTPQVKKIECPQSKNLNTPGQNFRPNNNIEKKKNSDLFERETHAHEIKQIFGEFENVRLTEEEHSKLEQRFGKEFLEKEIFSLSTYMNSNGKEYSDHYATLIRWCTQDKDKDKQSKGKSRKKYAFDEANDISDYEIFLNNFDIEPTKKKKIVHEAIPEFTESEKEEFQRRMDMELWEPRNKDEEILIIETMGSRSRSDKRYSMYFRQTYKVKYAENIPLFEKIPCTATR